MLFEEVKSAIENVRPSLMADGGDIELVSVSDDGVVKVRLTGRLRRMPVFNHDAQAGCRGVSQKSRAASYRSSARLKFCCSKRAAPGSQLNPGRLFYLR